ncbi:MAG: HAD family hydrolase [Thermoguttaceae bacterium]
MQTVRFVYFDLGNVLLKFSVRRLLHQVAELAEVSETDVREALFDDKRYVAYEMGEIDGIEYFAHICRQIGKTIPSDKLVAAINDIFWVNEPILPLIRHLADSFFPRGILSNTGPHHWDYIPFAYPNIWALFPSHRIASFAVHAMKPYPEMFKHALDEARRELPDLAPDQVLLIDDLEENAKGAADFGFRSIHYQDDLPLCEELKKFGVPVPEEAAE